MNGNPNILGLAASHNGASCLVQGRRLLVAVQEERITRRKRAPLDPGEFAGLDYVLEASNLRATDLDLVVLAPLFDAARSASRLAGHPALADTRHLFVSHHRAHAAGAFAQSGREQATVLVVDGAGSAYADLPDDERCLLPQALPPDARETVSIYAADRTTGLRPVFKQAAPPTDTSHIFAGGDVRPCMMPFTSLGVMYQSVAQQIFGAWDAAGKVMGLAPLGRPTLPVEAFLRPDGDAGLVFADGVSGSFRFGDRWPARQSAYMDLAASLQVALEAGLDHLVGLARALTDADTLCYAGGVALNSVANATVVTNGRFRDVWIMPAAEDSGTAVGAAVLGLWSTTDHAPGLLPAHVATRDGCGRHYSDSEIERAIERCAQDHDVTVTVYDSVGLACGQAAQCLVDGWILGFFQGRSELGPRALGQRSILMDPRRADGQDVLNARVKHREAFRPFAPAILEEHVDDWFDRPPHASASSPFMLHVWPFLPSQASRVPAVVHVDGTGRVQTVPAAPDTPYRQVIEAFHGLTGVPIVLNTSFNDAGEPIVETPSDALNCLMNTGLDACVLGRWLVSKRT